VLSFHHRLDHDLAVVAVAGAELDRWVELRTSYGDDGEIVIEAVVEGKHK